ncbi:MAG: hypothetical protein JSR67_10905 [Proteobacteria bacterium]|nr:hypothetical protein [Pseudomonadota bacterium]
MTSTLELRQAQCLPGASRAALFRELCLRKRSEVLAGVLGKSIGQRAVTALARTDWQRFASDDW